jgi:hypothetical protein
MTEKNFYYTIDPKTQAIMPIQLTVTIRDQFAMAALHMLSLEIHPKGAAEKAYAIADAMMEARK